MISPAFTTALPRALAFGAALLVWGCATGPKLLLPPLLVSVPTLPAAAAPRAAVNLRVFDAVWNEINRKYYDPRFNGADWSAAAVEFKPRVEAAPDEESLYKELNGMLALLDDGHTGAGGPALARQMKTQQMTGIGIRVSRMDDQWVVMNVFKGSGAEKAGVRPGWIVLSRDGRPFGDVLGKVPMVRGQVSRFEFIDSDAKRVGMEIPAGEVGTTTRESRILADGIAYVRFDEFDFDSISWLRERLDEYRSAPGLILDLRENPGGVIVVALYAIGHFTDNKDVAFVTLGRDEHRARYVPLVHGSARYEGPLVVLVSGDSASGSEVLAAVLQEKGRATVVGQRSGGSVLAAGRLALPDGGVLQYSVDDLLTARGRRLEGEGVSPDVPVPAPSIAELRSGRDAGLEAALKVLHIP